MNDVKPEIVVADKLDLPARRPAWRHGIDLAVWGRSAGGGAGGAQLDDARADCPLDGYELAARDA
jgi:hypothetical protein